METLNHEFIPINAIHPTEIIKDEMRARGLKRGELAKRMDMQLSNLSRFINKKESITSNIASKLEIAFGIKSEVWLNMQAAYDRDVVLISDRDIQEKEYSSIENLLSNVLNIALLFKQLSIDTYTFAQDRIKKLYSIFCVNSTDELIAISSPAGLFKKSEKLSSDERNIKTWVLLAHLECLKQNSAANYKNGNAVLAAEEIAKKANTEDITEKLLSDILFRYGIGYGVVNKIEKAPIDAYSTIMHQTPYVITSHRHNNMDMLVFDILHELKHIHTDLKDGESNLSCNDSSEINNDEKELEANKFAEDKLIPPHIWKKILSSSPKSLNHNHVFNAVVNEATKNGIKASIASWRYKHENKYYSLRGYSSQKIK